MRSDRRTAELREHISRTGLAQTMLRDAGRGYHITSYLSILVILVIIFQLELYYNRGPWLDHNNNEFGTLTWARNQPKRRALTYHGQVLL